MYLVFAGVSLGWWCEKILSVFVSRSWLFPEDVGCKSGGGGEFGVDC